MNFYPVDGSYINLDNINEIVNSDLLPNFDVKYDIHQFENAIYERLRKDQKDEI